MRNSHFPTSRKKGTCANDHAKYIRSSQTYQYNFLELRTQQKLFVLMNIK